MHLRNGDPVPEARSTATDGTRNRRFRAVGRLMSLRHRLPLIMLAALVAVGTTFLWTAHREVERALLIAAGSRIQQRGSEIAALIAQSLKTRVAETDALAADAAVRAATQSRRGMPPQEAPVVLADYVERNPQSSLWLYASDGRLLTALGNTDAPPMHALNASVDRGLEALRVEDGRAWYTTTAAVFSAASEHDPVGLLRIDRPLASPATRTLIQRLLGDHALLKLGDVARGVWTDFGAVASPAPTTELGAALTYVNGGGERRLGLLLPVDNTPWVLWIDVSEAGILDPASTLLHRMVPILGVFLLFGLAVVYGVSTRVTRPLELLTEAAEAFARGDHSRRVDVQRRDEIGRLAMAFNTLADRVSKSREALEARVQERTRELERARDKIDQFFAITPDLLCLADSDGRFQRVNPAWSAVLGWTEEDLLKAPYLDLVHPGDRDATAAEAAKLARGGTTLSFENRYRAKDGSYRWLSWKAATSPGSRLICATARDITDEKLSSDLLQRHALELASTNRELEAFSYSVSHDLRAPLRSIDGFAQALIEDYEERLDDTGRDFVRRIRTAAQRMGALIDDLLSLSRVARQELTRVPVDVTALAREIASRLEVQDRSRHVDWRIAPDLTAHADPRLLRIALENLLHNAWKFTARRESAVIELDGVRPRDGAAALLVRDNGAGFDMAYAGKLFGAFQRLHGASEFEGTGIGLATVQRIVHRHGGQISAHAEPGQGATFIFSLEPEGGA